MCSDSNNTKQFRLQKVMRVYQNLPLFSLGGQLNMYGETEFTVCASIAIHNAKVATSNNSVYKASLNFCARSSNKYWAKLSLRPSVNIHHFPHAPRTCITFYEWAEYEQRLEVANCHVGIKKLSLELPSVMSRLVFLVRSNINLVFCQSYP